MRKGSVTYKDNLIVVALLEDLKLLRNEKIHVVLRGPLIVIVLVPTGKGVRD